MEQITRIHNVANNIIYIETDIVQNGIMVDTCRFPINKLIAQNIFRDAQHKNLNRKIVENPNGGWVVTITESVYTRLSATYAAHTTEREYQDTLDSFLAGTGRF